MSRRVMSPKPVLVSMLLLALLATVVALSSRRSGGSLRAYIAKLKAQGEKRSIAELAPPDLPASETNLDRFLKAVAGLSPVSFDPGYVSYMRLSGGVARPVWTEQGLPPGSSNLVSWQSVPDKWKPTVRL